MSISKVKVGESHERLMHAIGETIRIHTSMSPLSVEAIAGILAFCSGAAIGRGSKTRNERRQYREMAVANIDFGLEAMTSSMANTSLILPEGMQ
jgi:hypothetical protein